MCSPALHIRSDISVLAHLLTLTHRGDLAHFVSKTYLHLHRPNLTRKGDARTVTACERSQWRCGGAGHVKRYLRRQPLRKYRLTPLLLTLQA